LRCWVIESSLSASHAQLFAPVNLPRVLAGFEGTWLESSQLPVHDCRAPKLFVFKEKEENFPSKPRQPM